MLSPTRRFRPDTPFADFDPYSRTLRIAAILTSDRLRVIKIAAIPERSLFLFVIFVGLLSTHGIAAIHGERNQHACHDGEIECEETPNER